MCVGVCLFWSVWESVCECLFLLYMDEWHWSSGAREFYGCGCRCRRFCCFCCSIFGGLFCCFCCYIFAFGMNTKIWYKKRPNNCKSIQSMSDHNKIIQNKTKEERKRMHFHSEKRIITKINTIAKSLKWIRKKRNEIINTIRIINKNWKQKPEVKQNHVQNICM